MRQSTGTPTDRIAVSSSMVSEVISVMRSVPPTHFPVRSGSGHPCAHHLPRPAHAPCQGHKKTVFHSASMPSVGVAEFVERVANNIVCPNLCLMLTLV